MFSQSLSIRQSQSIKLTQAQRILIRGYLFTLRLSLIQQLHDEQYQPKGECPNCYRKLTPIEIISGFNQDPNDFTTCCSSCGTRFEPILICFTDHSTIELPFYCDNQTLARMNGLEDLNPEEFSAKEPAIYRSAIVHHGSIRQAFSKIGIQYLFEEVLNWENKITGFLGRLSDIMIAQCVNVPVSSIGQLRRKLQIPRYISKIALNEIENN